jgi:hypothetical protein
VNIVSKTTTTQIEKEKEISAAISNIQTSLKPPAAKIQQNNSFLPIFFLTSCNLTG